MKTLVSLIAILAACGGGSEAASMDLSVVATARHVTDATTDLGYTVSVETMRVAVADIQFTTDGEESEASIASRALDWLVGSAHAHPGHAGGGEVIGELLGDHIIDWTAEGAPLGTGTLLEGSYTGANFLFRTATEADGLADGDLLLGHSIAATGTITRDADTWTFTMVFDVEPGTALVGAPFTYELESGATPTISLAMTTIDPFEGDTIFDGVELADLDTDDDGHITIEPGQPAHNALRRAFTKHDHYLVEAN